MYLFRGDLGCRLYTGDFRWELGCDKARSAKKALLDALAGDTVDVLYLDNTYCHPSLNFPPRRVVAEQVRFASVHCANFCPLYATLSLQPTVVHATKVLYAVYGRNGGGLNFSSDKCTLTFCADLNY